MSPAQRTYAEHTADVVGHAETLADYVLTHASAVNIPAEALDAAREVQTILSVTPEPLEPR